MENSPALGEIIRDGERRRDALHVAVVSATAIQRLSPCQHVGLANHNDFQAAPCEQNIGIVDPFLKTDVEPGQRFWLCLYPGTITSLRHIWSHPAFAGSLRTEAVGEEEACLLAILAEREDDEKTRMVYAECLDEHGRHDEADRQRKWLSAKQWLLDMCEGNSAWRPDGYWKLSYEHLIQAGKDALEQGYFDCVADMGLCDRLRAEPGVFWTNWSIVTGIRLPTEAAVESTVAFSCSC